MEINPSLLQTLERYKEHLPVALEGLEYLKEHYDPDSNQGICGNWCDVLGCNLSISRALNISHDIVSDYTGESYPIENYHFHEAENSLWKGDQLEQRLKLIDEIIEVLEAYMGGNYEV